VTDTLAAQAARFRSLHDPAAPLVLANAWDAASALIAEASGAPAVATTSAGVAWAQGYPDGDAIPRDVALAVVARIAAVVSVPVTADVEGGFGATADEVAATVDAVLEAGAVGINIEDGARTPEEFAERLRAARAAAERAGVPLFVNARTDVYLAGLVAPELRVAETLRRAERYLEAGADGIFVPGAADPDEIAALAAGIAAPLNIMAWPGLPAAAELGRLGVARVSLGSGVAQAAYGLTQRVNAELVASGAYSAELESAADYGALNALMPR
jgi:2-methylisocitrate lyase-like PEP mutase family enzyme